MENIYLDINKKSVHYGSYVEQIRDMFSRKQESSIHKKEDKFFSMYWQVYAWSAIIGFFNDKREIGTELQNQTSFQFQMISNGSETISQSLILMAIGKIEAKKSEEFLDSRKILTIISEYAEGGAKYILEIRQTPGFERKFDSPDDFLMEIGKR